jgi:hypothetical protein
MDSWTRVLSPLGVYQIPVSVNTLPSPLRPYSPRITFCSLGTYSSILVLQNALLISESSVRLAADILSRRATATAIYSPRPLRSDYYLLLSSERPPPVDHGNLFRSKSIRQQSHIRFFQGWLGVKFSTSAFTQQKLLCFSHNS